MHDDADSRTSPAREQGINRSSLDHGLIDRIRNDDSDALKTLIRTYAQRLEASAFLVVCRDDLAQDAVQDVFIRLWEQRSELSIQGNVSHYLFRAVRFRAISLVRHEIAEHRVEDLIRVAQISSPVFDTNAGDTHLHALEFTAVVQRTLQALPARCREIFLMHRVAGMDYTEIAAALEIAPATIHNQMSRATRALMEALQQADML